MNVKQWVNDFLKEEDGLTTVEYAVAGGIIAAGVVAAFGHLKDGVIAEIGAIYKALTGTDMPKS
ncbi:Flp family type IVb pilin [Endozoicomonas atrinae]|uniref:Flp family type IVb pilin n=1 Tax=Endozoicomonas atrinae TaxID=1333660 RepID=UPI0008244377|nr:hypothetical protein [Endozoicomonas atrinae]